MRVTLTINFPLDNEGNETKATVETKHSTLGEAISKIAKTVGWSSYQLIEVAPWVEV